MLRTSRTNPKLSAYHILEGQHYYNRVPYVSSGTKGTIFNPPKTRTSWGPRAIDAWYIGPAKNHYRCLQFHIPTTGGYRTSAQYKLYPQHIHLPTETHMDRAVHITQTLTNTIKNITKQNHSPPNKHTEVLEKLSHIFNQAATQQQTTGTPTPTSVNTTSRTQILKAKRPHDRFTRNNTPGIIPPSTSEEGDKHACLPIKIPVHITNKKQNATTNTTPTKPNVQAATQKSQQQ